jgi:cleavage and polyadenylation specificity factor subunit 3
MYNLKIADGPQKITLKSGIDERGSSESDYLEFMPLGAGNEVGRSCHIIKFKGKTVMLDCGIHPAYNGLDQLPYFDEINAKEIDIILISHFHNDHAAALPYLLKHTVFDPNKGRVYMTPPTKAIYNVILHDFIKVSAISADNDRDRLFTKEDLDQSMEKIQGINFHEVKRHNGIKFWCYPAGHVLGAAMFMIEIAGVKILYTGDYSRANDRHLPSAELPSEKDKPDILVIESTYGTLTLPPLERREERLCSLVHDTIKDGGRVLIPVFALGRAQELMLILEEYWAKTPLLRDPQIPIYYVSSMASKNMKVFKSFPAFFSKAFQTQLQTQGRNPFDFRYIEELTGWNHYSDTGPCVVLASPGMLQNGISRTFLEAWADNKKNGLVIAAYSVEGTLANSLLKSPESIVRMDGEAAREGVFAWMVRRRGRVCDRAGHEYIYLYIHTL